MQIRILILWVSKLAEQKCPKVRSSMDTEIQVSQNCQGPTVLWTLVVDKRHSLGQGIEEWHTLLTEARVMDILEHSRTF